MGHWTEPAASGPALRQQHGGTALGQQPGALDCTGPAVGGTALLEISGGRLCTALGQQQQAVHCTGSAAEALHVESMWHCWHARRLLRRSVTANHFAAADSAWAVCNGCLTGAAILACMAMQ